MIVLPPPTSIRPADDIAAMLRGLADDVETGADILNLFIVIEHEEEDDADVRVFGPCDDPYRVAGFLTKGARDVLP
ncbi:hypothetical protein U5A82_06200 [Sphingobium sp. CR2-8]|uniref:hypothetical protein n=1 Tax=Sphingobium sp. CR2-8 TaxID=1306534 RepID=UPI002DB9184C|nr:hypothetical protein [Sphingobium sp. CR2-8]MEC3910080.1 hypothetical protein [Sphingobium sp. CR2-8]